MTSPETPDPDESSRFTWGELLLALGVAFVVSYGQRKMSSITFDDALRRLAAMIRTPKPVEPTVPREWLRDLYDETR